MLECLTDLVKIQNCGDPVAGQHYINSLAGITLKSIDMIADEDQITYVGVWKDVQAQAATRFKDDVILQLQNCHEIDKDCDYEELICENKERLVNAWKYLLGNQLMLERMFSDRLNFYTTIKREEAKELKDFYQVEYENSLKQSVKIMDLSGCEMCCAPAFGHHTYLP